MYTNYEEWEKECQIKRLVYILKTEHWDFLQFVQDSVRLDSKLIRYFNDETLGNLRKAFLYLENKEMSAIVRTEMVRRRSVRKKWWYKLFKWISRESS